MDVPAYLVYAVSEFLTWTTTLDASHFIAMAACYAVGYHTRTRA